jgi:hypothetical protein
MKALILENMSHSEERFTKYLKQNHTVVRELRGLSVLSTEALCNALCDPHIEVLCFESTFANRGQMRYILNLLVNLKDTIAFNRIEVMYTHNDFDVFLNNVTHTDEDLQELVSTVFQFYEVYGVEWTQYERSDPGAYFKTLGFAYDTVRVEMHTEKDTPHFLYQRSPLLDLRASLRSNTLVEFSNELLKSKEFKNFFDEMRAMLDYQRELIESVGENTEEYLQNKKENENNRLVLEALHAGFKKVI